MATLKIVNDARMSVQAHTQSNTFMLHLYFLLYIFQIIFFFIYLFILKFLLESQNVRVFFYLSVDGY